MGGHVSWKALLVVSLSGVLTSFAMGCSSGPGPIVVGSKNFSGQVILGEIVAQLLEARHFLPDRLVAVDLAPSDLGSLIEIDGPAKARRYEVGFAGFPVAVIHQAP